jgi:CspA family cold shock protein
MTAGLPQETIRSPLRIQKEGKIMPMAETLTAERLMADRVMGKGTVKWLSDEKDYGFVSPDEGDDDLPAHFAFFADGGFATLTEGARVEFEVHEGRRGLEAFDVVPIGAPAVPERH